MYELVFLPYHIAGILTWILPLVRMTQFLSDELHFFCKSDGDNGLEVFPELVYRKVVENGKKFSEWCMRATKKITKPVNR